MEVTTVHRQPAQADPAADDCASDPSDRTAADQRGARAQRPRSWPSRTSRSTQEQGSGAGLAARWRRRQPNWRSPPVQVRVPREHVARAAHAPQLDPDPRSAAGRQPSGALATKEVEFARNIHSAGTDLLTLINDILDLSKIESGTVTVDVEEIPFASLRETARRTFHHVADSKHLDFSIAIDKELPRTFTSDPKRLQQILKNLLSNAFKFTHQGRVDMRVRQVTSGWSQDHPVLQYATSAVAIEVEDSGIGIAPQKQKLIFEAFQQADAGTSRKFGGTGLGLAISRELAILLGGEIRLVSAPGQGSQFTLYLPFNYTGPARVESASGATEAVAHKPAVLASVKADPVVLDDRDTVQEGDQTVLIVDDDPHYARVLLGVARDRGFKGIVTGRGHAALALARQYLPTAITLDVFLPDMLGWTVLNDLKLDASMSAFPGGTRDPLVVSLGGGTVGGAGRMHPRWSVVPGGVGTADSERFREGCAFDGECEKVASTCPECCVRCSSVEFARANRVGEDNRSARTRHRCPIRARRHPSGQRGARPGGTRGDPGAPG